VRYIDECNLYFTSLCGGVVRQIFNSLNLVVSLTGGSTEVRDLGADGNNRTPLNNSVSTRQVQLGQGTISGGITINWDKLFPCIQVNLVHVNITLQKCTDIKINVYCYALDG